MPKDEEKISPQEETSSDGTVQEVKLSSEDGDASKLQADNEETPLESTTLEFISERSTTPHSSHEEFVDSTETPASSIHTEDVRNTFQAVVAQKNNGEASTKNKEKSQPSQLEKLIPQSMDEVSLDEDSDSRPVLAKTQSATSASRKSPFGWFKNQRSPSVVSVSKESPASSPPHMDRRPTSYSTNSTFSEFSVNTDLLVQRLEANSRTDEGERESKQIGVDQLVDEFVQKRKEGDEAIDWDFWDSIIRNPVSGSNPHELAQAVCSGLPAGIRGTLWQILSNSRNTSLEEIYVDLQDEVSLHEKSIKKDISRTSFKNEGIKPDDMFNVVKAYGIYDPEVGYTQGMTFLAAPILLNAYSFRSLFLAEMPGLHLYLYYFDRLLEQFLPTLSIHLSRQGVKSSMYASQWFLTLFAYKFPLSIVLRIFDVVVVEGIEAILRFGVALVRRSETQLLRLELDSLIPFLKEKLFESYLDTTPGLFGKEAYRVNEMVADAYSIPINTRDLRRWESEYEVTARSERDREEEIQLLRTTNTGFAITVRRLEKSLVEMSREHVEIANEMVTSKMENARLSDENDNLKQEVSELKGLVDRLPGETEERLQAEMDTVMQRNLKVVGENQVLEDQLAALEKELVDTKMQFATVHDAHGSLHRKMTDIRKILEE